MKIKSIKSIQSPKDDNGINDFTIYIDTDSIFVSAVPVLNHRFPTWKSMNQADVAVIVNEIAAEMQDYINEFYDILSKRIFNVDAHRFQIKKEFVSKSGIWVAKKRYAQWIISDNGIPVDKLDVKGLDVVRSSYPAAFRKFMSEILIQILKGSDESEITEKIYNFKKNLPSMNVVLIAKAGSVKELSKYLPDKKDSALFRFKLGTPAHVKASIAYNQLLKHFGIHNQYPPIKDGDKIKWVYLKTNAFGLESIAMNGYNDPPQIMEIVNSFIDHDKLFKSELQNKLEDFYKALNWGTFLSSTKTVDKFFNF